MRKLAANISLDLDNKWSYMKTADDPAWQDFPTYLPQVVPQILEILAKHDLNITVFVVGKDATIPENQQPLKHIVSAGHEIANHSFMHEPWLQRYSRDEITEEFDKAEAAISKITDRPLRGFRGPGYSLSSDILAILNERGYLYDCSTFPTFLGPLARTYYFFKSKLSPDEDRQNLFGSFWDGFRSLKPYHWKTPGGDVLEIPVTTMPLLRAPFHFSYLHFLAQRSEFVAVMYLRLAIALCKITRTRPSMLLHPLDFLGGDEVKELAFFPGMQLSGERKRQLSDRFLGIYCRAFDVTNMSDHADKILKQADSVKRKTFA